MRRSVRQGIAAIFGWTALAWAGSAWAQPSTWVAVAVVGGGPREAITEIATALRTSLAKMPAVALLPEPEESRLFRSPPPPAIEPAVGVSRRLIARAERAFQSFRLQDAAKLLEEARPALEPWRGRPEAVETLRRYLALAASLAHAERNTTAADQALVEYALAFPGEPPPGGASWPPALAGRLPAVQPERVAAINLRSRPPATVYLDGRNAGTTPLEIRELTAGEHRIVLEAAHHFRRDFRVTLSAGPPTPFDVELDPDLSQLLAKVSLAEPTKREVTAQVGALAAEHGVDLVVLAEPRSAGLALERLDPAGAKGGAAARVVIASRSATDVDRGLAQLIHGLEGGEPAPPIAAQGPGLPWWLWAGVGAGVVLAGVGTALRFDAVAVQGDFDARRSALTQSEAFAIRDDGDARALRGSLLIGAGAAIAVGLVTYALLGAGADGS